MKKAESFSIQDAELEYYLRLAPLIKGVFRNYDMKEIMSLIEDILCRPVMVIDMGFKVINESPAINDDYKLYERNDIFLAEEFIDKIKSNHLYLNLNRREFSATLITSSSNKKFIAASIKTNANDVMMLIVFESGLQFEKQDYAMIKKICSILGVQYQKEGLAYFSHMAMPNHIIFALLNGENVSRDEFQNRVNSFEWTKYDKIYFMIIDTEKKDVDFRPRHSSILKSMLSFIDEHHCFTYKNIIIGFLGVEQFENIYSRKKDSFNKFLEANGIICAISQFYSDIMDSRKYYFSTMNLIRCMRKYRLRKAYFPEARLFLLHEFITKNYDISLFYHPTVLELARYDYEHKSNFLLTLDTYLNHKSNPDEAAKKLFIHRSTLFYRVNKIKELTGFDTEDSDQITQFIFSMKLREINSLL